MRCPDIAAGASKAVEALTLARFVIAHAAIRAFDMAEVPGLADALAAGREDALAVGLVGDGHRVVAGRTAPCEDRSARGAA